MRRRGVLKKLLAAAAGCALGGPWRSEAARASTSARSRSPAQPAIATEPGAIEIALDARSDEVAILDGAATSVWRFDARQTAGRSVLAPLGGDSYLGPTLDLRRGDRLRVAFRNGLPEPSIVHWHGLDVPHDSDGHPTHAVATGGEYRYAFTVINRPGTYWYHAHPDPRTGPQVYRGLAGAIVVRDEDEEGALGLPEQDHELLFVLQDRLFGEGNRLNYSFHPMLGFLGDRILVNGRLPEPVSVRAGSYRLRILNGSNSRVYKLAWSDESPLVVVATDGGLLAGPREVPYAVLAPGQRLELWADFGLQPRGNAATLRSLPFDGVLPGMMGGMGGMSGMGGRGRGMGRGPGGGMGMMGGGPPLALGQGAAFDIQTFVVKEPGRRRSRPERFSSIPTLAPPVGAPLRVATSWQHMQWTLNGRTFDMHTAAADEKIPLGAIHEWELFNPPEGMAMAHPIHLHGPQFQIVERSFESVSRAARESLGAGLIDDGWLDTVLLFPGERIRLRAKYERYSGLFLYHCHNLEHEDMGMMRNFEVVG